MERVWWYKNKDVIFLALLGALFFMVAGVWWYKAQVPIEVEVLNTGVAEETGKIWIDVSGAVIRPGVYELVVGSRVKDALLMAGGLSEEADRGWVEQVVNLAEEIKDGEKIFIPKIGESGEVAGVNVAGGMVNINKASTSELDSLWGIGSARAKAIVDGRPYGSIEELVERNVIPSNVFEAIKGEISVY